MMAVFTCIAVRDVFDHKDVGFRIWICKRSKEWNHQ